MLSSCSFSTKLRSVASEYEPLDSKKALSALPGKITPFAWLCDFSVSFFNCCSSASLYFLEFFSSFFPSVFLAIFALSWVHNRQALSMASLEFTYAAASSIPSSSLLSFVLPLCVCNNVWMSVLSRSISSSLNTSSSFLFASGRKSGLICATKKKFWIVFLASWVSTLPSSHTNKASCHVSACLRSLDT